MKLMQILQTWLLITLLALSANGTVNAKVTSGHQNLGSEASWDLNDSKSLIALGVSDVSTIHALGSSLVPNGGGKWNKTTVLDRTVHQRSDLFDPTATSAWRVRGKTVQGTNLERMSSGRAPVGFDGKPVELHHLTQTEVNGLVGKRGALAEVGSVFHSTNTKVLHVPSSSAKSFRTTRFKDSPEYRNPNSKYVSAPKQLNAKTSTKQSKEFNAYQSDYWKLRAQGFK